jgi:CrcB protein
MKQLLFIALGGAGGALARHWLSTVVHASAQSHFPWGTLLVNVLGSFAIGIAYIAIVERGALHPDWRSVTMVGFLGAFTTFSTFSLETLALLENGQAVLAVGYVVASLVVCLLAVWGAATLMRLI